MHEEINEDFLAARLKDDKGQGNLMKLSGCYLKYISSDPAYYQNLTHSTCLNNTIYSYESNVNDWTDFVDFLAFLDSDTTSDEVFLDQIEHRLDVPTFLRTMVIETFLLASDCFANNGKNYYIYHMEDDKDKDKWTVIVQDFDMMFSFSFDGNVPDKSCDVYDFLLPPDESPSQQNQLLIRLLAFSKYRDDYEKYYQTFIDTVFASDVVEQPSKRHTDLMQFLLPWVARDKMVKLSSQLTPESFVLYAEQTSKNLPWRQLNVTNQLKH